MVWTAKCQRVRWFKNTPQQWTNWADLLTEEGFGRFTKQGWTDWIEKMNSSHPQTEPPPPHAQEPPPPPAQPEQGPPLQGQLGDAAVCDEVQGQLAEIMDAEQCNDDSQNSDSQLAPMEVFFTKWTIQEWIEWTDSLPETGYGIYHKQEWQAWLAQMKGQLAEGPPAQGPPAQGSGDAAGSHEVQGQRAGKRKREFHDEDMHPMR